MLNHCQDRRILPVSYTHLVGVDSAENEVVLFGVDAAYPMQNGDMSTGLIAAVPLEYITDFLSLEDKDQLMYYHIIRPDGSFVIQNPNTELWQFFEQPVSYTHLR